ncbi:asparagine synthase-related protein [Nocardioides sp. W7]|uniref:asparagine synthase-related protein n=1 Tax=Nocardioides sp. W7 TaxID=2931390 RepID=UPI001FD067D8|nr:asparagine synthase-related protein [Nocardioides sp. W7]
MTTLGPAAGFVAVTVGPGAVHELGGLLDRGLDVLDVPADRSCTGTVAFATWGDARPPGPERALVLTAEARRHEQALTAAHVHRALMTPDLPLLAQVLPPFAAVTRDGVDTVLAVVDPLGMRQLYVRRGPRWSAVSTSARVLAGLLPVGLDLEAVAVQSRLGWQLGRRTLFAGVEQVPAGSLLRLYGGTVHRRDTRSPEQLRPVGPAGPADAATTVAETRDLLRDYLAAYLDDHPDPVLQLTGGQDSRLLLSAIDPARRRGLRVLTLGVPGSPDVAMAAELARREGMRHEVLDLTGLDVLAPEEAWALTATAAGALELAADPVARAALDVAESRARPGARLSGLGGEVARGFYYLGTGADAPVTTRRAHRLARWRMYVNEAVAPDMLAPEFGAWAQQFALDEVHRVLAASGDPWFAATDRLYLEERMQRWAGATETAVCQRTAVANPMLDDRFVAAVGALAPADKRGSRFLGRLSVTLDPGLADLPLDGRPSPRSYAEAGWGAAAARARATGAAAGRKAAQRLSGGRRAPAGGGALAGGVAAYWRHRPEVLDPVRSTGLLREEWLDRVVSGAVVPDPASTAFMVNVTLATTVASVRPASGASPI